MVGKVKVVGGDLGWVGERGGVVYRVGEEGVCRMTMVGDELGMAGDGVREAGVNPAPTILRGREMSAVRAGRLVR
jgi:hypothetical protein